MNENKPDLRRHIKEPSAHKTDENYNLVKNVSVGTHVCTMDALYAAATFYIQYTNFYVLYVLFED